MLKSLKLKTISALIRWWGEKKEKKIFSAPPVIIGGCGRSGTTLLLSILDAHPHIYSIPEQTYAFMAWKQRSDRREPEPYRLDRLYRKLVGRRIPAGTARWCEKTPMHVRFFKQILDWYGPDVRLIHLVRDGRDVVTSKHPSGPERYWVPVSRWVQDVSAGLAFKDHPQVLTVKYEDLVNSFDSTIRAVFTFLGEECPDTIADWARLTRVRKSRHWHGSVKDLYANAIGRWQAPEHAQRIAELVADPEAAVLLEKLGYR